MDETPATEANRLPEGTLRRRFLKGTGLALPAVVTLHSGAARAAVSLGCGGNGNVSQTGYAILTTQDHADDRLRAAVELYRKVQVKSGGNAANVPADWEVNTSDPGSYFQGNGVWRKLDGSEVTGNELQALVALAATAPTSTTIRTGTTRYAIVHVNTSNGSVAAIGSPDPIANAIVTSWTGACMASLYGVSP